MSLLVVVPTCLCFSRGDPPFGIPRRKMASHGPRDGSCTGDESMRFLVVAEDFPWPQTGGGLIRLATAVTALCELGEVDLFTLVRRHRTLPPTVPPSVKVARLQTVP